MLQRSISYIDISFFAYATEDVEKVIEAVHRVLPTTYIEDIAFRRSNLNGHHSNPIILFESRIKKREILNAFIETLFRELDKMDKEKLRDEIHAHIGKGSLYVRLDKQAAFRNQFKLCKADPIRVRIRFRRGKIKNIIAACTERGLFT